MREITIKARYNTIYYVIANSKDNKLRKFYIGDEKPSMEEAKKILEDEIQEEVNIIKVLITYNTLTIPETDFNKYLNK